MMGVGGETCKVATEIYSDVQVTQVGTEEGHWDSQWLVEGAKWGPLTQARSPEIYTPQGPK